MTKTLIVDDELPAVLLLQKLFDAFPVFVNISIATKPAAAYQEILTQQPDFLFLDIEMPELDGLKLHEKIKVHSPNTKVIFVQDIWKYYTNESIAKKLQ